MNKTKKIKDFNCLEFKDKIQEKIYGDIRNLNIEQEIEYFSNKVKQGSFMELVKSINYSERKNYEAKSKYH